MPEIPADSLDNDALFRMMWTAGDLRGLLHAEQLRLYDKYRAWQAQMRDDRRGKYRRVFVVGWSRRVGKDWWCAVVKLEDCIRNAGEVHTYATAYAKDVAEIVIPIIDELLETCPLDLRPKFHAASMGHGGGYYFDNGSRLPLVGLDLHPNGVRGRGSDGMVITEAAFVSKLEDTVLSVIYPQLQGRQRATIILQSTAPEVSAGNAFDEVFLPDARLRDAYDERTIDDNPMLSDDERDEFIDAAGGRESPRAQREYFNVRMRDPSKAVVPEYDDKRHVAPVASPEYAHCYVGIDPGVRDMCGVVWGYWDPWRARLMVQRDFAERNFATGKLARLIADTELELWGQVTYFDGDGLRTNPFRRVSDVDLRLIGDLQAEHRLSVSPVDRTDDKEARLFALRDAFAKDKIQIDPSCVTLRAHVSAATWNKRRTEYERTEAHGHYDCLDALEIMWRSVNRSLNPRPPDHWLDRSVIMHKREHLRGTSSTAALGRALGGKPSWQMGKAR